jgi:hypothetical protein
MYVRAATACAFSASTSKATGISPAIAPGRYCSITSSRKTPSTRAVNTVFESACPPKGGGVVACVSAGSLSRSGGGVGGVFFRGLAIAIGSKSEISSISSDMLIIFFIPMPPL